MARKTNGPRVICDGCEEIIATQLVSDLSDPNKGMLVNENWYGKCSHCQYEFLVTVQMHDGLSREEPK